MSNWFWQPEIFLAVVALALAASSAMGWAQSNCAGKFCAKRLVAVFGFGPFNEGFQGGGYLYFGDYCLDQGSMPAYLFSPIVLPTDGNCTNNCSRCVVTLARSTKAKEDGTPPSPTQVHSHTPNVGIPDFFSEVLPPDPSCNNDVLVAIGQLVKVNLSDASNPVWRTFKRVHVTDPFSGTQAFYAFEVSETATEIGTLDEPPNGTKVVKFTYNGVGYTGILKDPPPSK